MNVSNCQLRRSTVDDLADLRRMWNEYNLPVATLEKRLTEFQIVETPDGQVLGTIGLQISGLHAKIHSEAYKFRELSLELRPRLWDRIKSLARGQRLVRLWIPQEPGVSVFWGEEGFEVPSAHLLTQLPPALAETHAGSWLTLQLREQSETRLSPEQELAIFQHQAEQSARINRQLRIAKTLAALAAFGILALVMYASWYILTGFNGPGRH